jgi:hypothetical protein
MFVPSSTYSPSMAPSINFFQTTGQPIEIVSEFIALGDKTIEPSDTENDNAIVVDESTSLLIRITTIPRSSATICNPTTRKTISLIMNNL